MEITAKIWDKTSSINGKDDKFISSHFKKQNGNDDRVLISFDGVVGRIEPLSTDFFTAIDRAYMNDLISGGMEHTQAIAETWGEKVRNEVKKNEEQAEKEEQAAKIQEQNQADILYLSIMTGVEL